MGVRGLRCLMCVTGIRNVTVMDKTNADRQKRYREKQKALRMGGVTGEEVVTDVMTETDQKFEEKKPGYWIYETSPRERNCWMCGKNFETRMELNKFCSPECKEKFLDDSLRASKKLSLSV